MGHNIYVGIVMVMTRIAPRPGSLSSDPLRLSFPLNSHRHYCRPTGSPLFTCGKKKDFLIPGQVFERGDAAAGGLARSILLVHRENLKSTCNIIMIMIIIILIVA